MSAALVGVSVVQGRTPAVELSELPLLTMVLILVYLGAQAGGHVVDQLTIAQQEIIERSHHELESLRHQVEQAQRLELLGRASLSSAHDLRNVFSVINGCAEELNDEMYGRRAATRGLEILQRHGSCAGDRLRSAGDRDPSVRWTTARSTCGRW